MESIGTGGCREFKCGRTARTNDFNDVALVIFTYSGEEQLITIHHEFRRLSDFGIDELLHAYGVYVLWAGKSKARPTYIGEGDIWSRLSQHRRKFPRPIDGYVTVAGNKKRVGTKLETLIVEAVLLAIGKSKDRLPTQNRRQGNLQNLAPVIEKCCMLKIYMGGFDPFQEPGTGRPLSAKRVVSIFQNGDGDIAMEHSWRLRRIRRN